MLYDTILFNSVHCLKYNYSTLSRNPSLLSPAGDKDQEMRLLRWTLRHSNSQSLGSVEQISQFVLDENWTAGFRNCALTVH